MFPMGNSGKSLCQFGFVMFLVGIGYIVLDPGLKRKSPLDTHCKMMLQQWLALYRLGKIYT